MDKVDLNAMFKSCIAAENVTAVVSSLEEADEEKEGGVERTRRTMAIATSVSSCSKQHNAVLNPNPQAQSKPDNGRLGTLTTMSLTASTAHSQGHSADVGGVECDNLKLSYKGDTAVNQKVLDAPCGRFK